MRSDADGALDRVLVEDDAVAVHAVLFIGADEPLEHAVMCFTCISDI